MSSMYYSRYTLVYIIYIYKDILSLLLSFLNRAEMPTESPSKTVIALPNDYLGLPNDYIDRTGVADRQGLPTDAPLSGVLLGGVL